MKVTTSHSIRKHEHPCSNAYRELDHTHTHIHSEVKIQHDLSNMLPSLLPCQSRTLCKVHTGTPSSFEVAAQLTMADSPQDPVT